MFTNSISSLRLRFNAFLLVLLSVFVSLLVLSVMPRAVHAQASTTVSLSDTIRAAILKDPRSSSLTEAQIDAMVSALSNQAQAQGMTPQDIAYHPGAFVGVPAGTGSQNCVNISSFLCPLGMALGYDTPDKSVPIGLWITSGILIVVIWELRKHEALVASPKPPSSSGGPLG